MPYKFKVGDKGKTRGGQPYRVICTDRDRPDYPVVALVGSVGDVLYYTAHGHYLITGAHKSHDLMPPTVTKWLNVWLHGKGNTPHSQLHAAKQYAEDAAEQYSADTNVYLVIAQRVEVQES